MLFATPRSHTAALHSTKHTLDECENPARLFSVWALSFQLSQKRRRLLIVIVCPLLFCAGEVFFLSRIVQLGVDLSHDTFGTGVEGKYYVYVVVVSHVHVSCFSIIDSCASHSSSGSRWDRIAAHRKLQQKKSKEEESGAGSNQKWMQKECIEAERKRVSCSTIEYDVAGATISPSIIAATLQLFLIPFAQEANKVYQRRN